MLQRDEEAAAATSAGQVARREPDVRVAYLNSQYPALSHTFIEREIYAVRNLGIGVDTFSVRPVPPDDVRSRAMREEADRTSVLLGGDVRAWLTAAGRIASKHPQAAARGALTALRSGDTTPRARLWQTFYYGEAVVLHHQMRQRGLRHVHVHHANVAADVARLVCRIGCSIDGPGTWTWSLTMHGSSEFADVRGVDLAAKVRDAQAIACISDYTRGQLMRLVGREHWAKMRVVRMSVDAEVYRPPAAGRVHDGPLRALAVGRMDPVKGFDLLVEACAQLRDQGVELDLRIIGQGPEQDALQRHIDAAGLHDRIHLLGAVGQDDIVQHYHWADVYLLSSFMEGLPVVLMEAMSTELPVVATRVAAMSELIADGRNGLLVDVARPDQIAEAVARLASDSALRARMGAEGRRTVLAEFTPRTTGPAMADFLRAAAGRSPVRA